MPIKISRLKAGDQIWKRTRQKMGNTTMSETVFHPVTIVSIDPEGCFVMLSWNYNPPRKVFTQNNALPSEYCRNKPDSRKTPTPHRDTLQPDTKA